MFVLVDFDNIEANTRRYGVDHVVDRIVRLVDFDPVNDRRVDVRLYGGWYEDRTITQYAQVVVAELQARYPCPICLDLGGREFRAIVAVEMAYSLAIQPEKHVFSTYRPRDRPPHVIRCRAPKDVGCSDPRCPMSVLFQVVKRGRCLTTQCTHKLHDFLYCGQQKLVDSMLLTDLFYYVNSGEPHVVIVSSDDDITPGIIAAASSGTRVTHIHPKPNSRRAYSYLVDSLRLYHAKDL